MTSDYTKLHDLDSIFTTLSFICDLTDHYREEPGVKVFMFCDQIIFTIFMSLLHNVVFCGAVIIYLMCYHGNCTWGILVVLLFVCTRKLSYQ